jgi:glucose-6-phosphate isomerase
MLPLGVSIDPKSGAMSAATGRYTKRLGEMRAIYQDEAALDARLVAEGDIVTYEVVEYLSPGSDMFFGTTTIYPGHVGDEYFMTRGHFHARRDRAEVYYTQSGEGVLLLESRDGETRTVDMKPGICAYIPADWAHRSINTGDTPLVFVWVGNADAGHDYATILTRGMRSLVVCRDGKPVTVPNPKFAA